MANIKPNVSDKTILLTFDYELFLKKSGTLENCILKPVDKLIEYFDAHNIKGTFFIDVLYYMRLLESSETAEDANRLKCQLQQLIAKGNRIELHLHPQWLDAQRDGREWVFPTLEHYRLHDLPDDKVTDLFISGVELLEGVAREVDADYKVIAFRAGGLCIQPFDKLKDGFIKSGIVVDSTVIKHFKLDEDTHHYDFMKAPDSAFYRFSDDPVRADENGPFYEIPITSYMRGFSDKFIGKAVKRLRREDFKVYGDGAWIAPSISLLKRITPSYGMFTLEEAVPVMLDRRVAEMDKPLINFISHPKALSPVSFDALERLCSREYVFATIFDVFEDIRSGVPL